MVLNSRNFLKAEQILKIPEPKCWKNDNFAGSLQGTAYLASDVDQGPLIVTCNI